MIFTVPPTHHHPETFLQLILTQNQYRLTISKDILIIIWKQVSCTSQLTPCPPNLKLQTLWMGVILTGKMTFWGVLNKSWSCYEDRPPEHSRFYLTNKILHRAATHSISLKFGKLSLLSAWRFYSIQTFVRSLKDKSLTSRNVSPFPHTKDDTHQSKF